MLTFEEKHSSFLCPKVPFEVRAAFENFRNRDAKFISSLLINYCKCLGELCTSEALLSPLNLSCMLFVNL